MARPLKCQLTTKDWKRWSLVRSRASFFFFFFVTAPSTAQENWQGSAGFLSQHTLRTQPPAPCCFHLLSLGSRSAPNPYRMDKDRPQPFMALLASWSLLGKMQVTLRALYHQAEPLTATGNDFRCSCLTTGCSHPSPLAMLQSHSGSNDKNKERKTPLF